MCMCGEKYVHVCEGARGGWRHQISLELELEVVMSYYTWVLEIKLGPSRRALSSLYS